ncbi:MAG: DNRLRE domain-containing protein [Bacteroidota bacterium]|nr:DNRLRE domain-containing protein [Bacteroidota bacterium]
MKKTLALFFCFVTGTLLAQTTVSIRPNASIGKDALIDSRTAVANTTHGNTADFASWAWTSGGITIARSLIQFDLSGIPLNAVITDAKISFYCNTTSSIAQLHSGSNASYIQRITSSWNEDSVTWNNQPTTTDTNQVSLPESTSQTQNYLNIDVTQLVVDMKNNPTRSFGFMIRLQTEATYRSLIFASSDHSDSTKRPIFTYTYTIPANCPNSLVLQPNAAQGKDALIDSRTAVSNTNYGTSADFASWAWTNNGTTYARSLIQFDISGIPANAVITEAKLSLHCNTTSSITQLNSGSNESYLKRITQSWKEDSVTWNNQPLTTDSHQVSLAQSISQTQDYLNIDVTQLAIDMKNNPSTSFGFMLRLKTESIYRSLIMASSDHTDAAKRPKLSICYTIPSGFAVISPNGGEKLIKNQPFIIRWNIANASNIGLQYTVDNGGTWNIITASTAAITGSYTWNVPNVLSNLCRIKIINISDTAISDISDSTFSIVNPTSILLISPNGGETWYINKTNTITWTSTNVTNVKLNYSLNNGASWVFLGSTNSNTTGGAYAWNIPPTIPTGSAKIKVSDASDSLISDMSDSIFTITWLNDGLTQLLNEKGFILYPNPSTGIFNLTFENNGKPYTIRILNINGQLIEKKENITTDKLVINNDKMSNNKGIYFVEVECNGAILRKKMVVY